MSEKISIFEKGKDAVKKIDVSTIKEKAGIAGAAIKDKAGDIKDTAIRVKEDINDKLTELDRMLETEITNYNDAYTLMNDKGIRLFVERNRAVDAIENVKFLINSIANKPKSFDEEFETIEINRKQFTDSCEFAEKEIKAARVAAGGAGAGLAAGASVAFMAPTAAMWIATTFGTASTGTAISALSGAAATNAALAWLGGGALATGGGGMAAGEAFLALAGPVGWTIAGATLLTSIVLFAKSRTKLNAEKNEEIEKVKRNTEIIREMDAKLEGILNETSAVRNGLISIYGDSLSMFRKDYNDFSNDQKSMLGNLVNNTLTLSAFFTRTISEDQE